jgi:hypothetical protein
MKQTNLILKSLLVIIITVFLCMNVYAYIYGNGAGGGYGGPGESSGGSSICSQNNDIEYLIILGAGHYLDAKTDIQQLLKAVEWQDIRVINYTDMQSLVDSALVHMKYAAYTYDILIRTAEATPYNEAVQALLKGFNYEVYMLENGLNQDLFYTVRSYLQAGDITGIFKRTRYDYSRIIRLLESVKKDLYYNKMPGLSIFRQLNETLDNTSTIGSYVARIFAAIQYKTKP